MQILLGQPTEAVEFWNPFISGVYRFVFMYLACLINYKYYGRKISFSFLDWATWGGVYCGS